MKTVKFKNLLPVYLKGLISGKYTLQQASRSTGYSIGWLCELKQKYKVMGSTVFEHGNKNRIPVNKKSKLLREKIAAIYVQDFQDVNFSYFQKRLLTDYNISISWPTLKEILTTYGQKSPEARKVKKHKKCKRMRSRRECEGDLLQIDGTPFQWFYKFNDKTYYCLTGSIDDASGKITGLYMTEHECLYGYLEIMRQTCTRYGIPREIYSDRAAIFCVTPNKNKKLDKWEELAVMHGENTQWQRVLNELSVRQVLAWSPEAKGRVERMWRTIQGQLPVWFKLHHISTVEEANKHLQEYIDEFNAAYSVKTKDDETYWLECKQNLDDVLQCRISRRTNSAGVFSFHCYKFELCAPYPAYKTFELCISEKGIMGKLEGKYYPVRLLDDILDGLGETMPQVLQNIIYRYLFSYAKEISA